MPRNDDYGTCPTCGGDGSRYDDHADKWGETCEKCGGTGEVLALPPIDGSTP
jgi:DnaJ-class molecular chaperone